MIITASTAVLKEKRMMKFDYIIGIIWSQNHGVHDVHDETPNLLAA